MGCDGMYIDKEEKAMIQGNNGNHREKRKHNKETVADNEINDTEIQTWEGEKHKELCQSTINNLRKK